MRGALEKTFAPAITSNEACATRKAVQEMPGGQAKNFVFEAKQSEWSPNNAGESRMVWLLGHKMSRRAELSP